MRQEKLIKEKTGPQDPMDEKINVNGLILKDSWLNGVKRGHIEAILTHKPSFF